MTQNHFHEDRNPVAAGRFYPAGPEELSAEINRLLAAHSGCRQYMNARAIIVPHAGYCYSGMVAAAAYAAIPSGREYENIILIGSSHHISFKGASVYKSGDYITPLGRVTVNKEIAGQLISGNEHFEYRPDAHMHEHSLEVQLPFIQCHFTSQPMIVPVVIGTGNPDLLRSVSAALEPLFSESNLFIISSDFSHYPSWSDAERTDRETADAIISGEPEELLRVVDRHRKEKIEGLATSMCGLNAGLALMFITRSVGGCTYRHLKYMNSGDSRYGDKDHVVGYHSFIVSPDKEETLSVEASESGMFSSDDCKTLLEIARRSIEAGLEGRYRTYRPDAVPGSLLIGAGAFVSLHTAGRLRGCIGRLKSDGPLFELVADMAYSAAFEDSRFTPVTSDEFRETEIEISVISPMRRIDGPDEIVIGKHGICIRREGRTGVLLPQVASERGWSVIEFLEHASDKKAGLGKDGWKDADIYIFEAFIISGH